MDAKGRFLFLQRRADFAAEGRFHNEGAFSQPISQPISQLRNGEWGLRNDTRVPKGGFAAAKIFAEGAMRLRNHFAAKGLFRSGGLISQRLPWGYEIISQPRAIFAGGYFWLRNFADH